MFLTSMALSPLNKVLGKLITNLYQDFDSKVPGLMPINRGSFIILGLMEYIGFTLHSIFGSIE